MPLLWWRTQGLDAAPCRSATVLHLCSSSRTHLGSCTCEPQPAQAGTTAEPRASSQVPGSCCWSFSYKDNREVS